MLRFGESIGSGRDRAVVREDGGGRDEGARAHPASARGERSRKPQAVDAAEEIIRAADCVMVARGGPRDRAFRSRRVPILQEKRLLEQAGRLARPSITATQMLDSMVASSRPTRAEGRRRRQRDPRRKPTRVMLSQETAVGAYPVGTVEMMGPRSPSGPSAPPPYKAWNDSRVNRDTRDPRLHRRVHGVRRRTRELHLAAARGADSVRPVSPPDLRPPPRGADLRALARQGDGPAVAASCGACRPPRCAATRLTEALIADAANRGLWSSGGSNPERGSGSPRGCRAATRAPPA